MMEVQRPVGIHNRTYLGVDSSSMFIRVCRGVKIKMHFFEKNYCVYFGNRLDYAARFKNDSPVRVTRLAKQVRKKIEFEIDWRIVLR
jgi:hypothetical protein